MAFNRLSTILSNRRLRVVIQNFSNTGALSKTKDPPGLLNRYIVRHRLLLFDWVTTRSEDDVLETRHISGPVLFHCAEGYSPAPRDSSFVFQQGKSR
jgi:hypothetical protein